MVRFRRSIVCCLLFDLSMVEDMLAAYNGKATYPALDCLSGYSFFTSTLEVDSSKESMGVAGCSRFSGDDCPPPSELRSATVMKCG